jgi:hypothetical protein
LFSVASQSSNSINQKTIMAQIKFVTLMVVMFAVMATIAMSAPARKGIQEGNLKRAAQKRERIIRLPYNFNCSTKFVCPYPHEKISGQSLLELFICHKITKAEKTSCFAFN